MASTRVQVILDEDEREAFRRRARSEGTSLSAWIREAARSRLEQDRAAARGGDLVALFEACDARESGREPDWEELLRTIAESRGQGRSGT